MDYKDLYIVQEYIKEQLPIIENQVLAEQYYHNNIAEMNHDFFALLVDEKINYMLGKQPTFRCDNTVYLEQALEILGDDVLYSLQELAREASIKSIAWMQAYIDKEGILRFTIIPSEEIIPVWKDKRHKELDWVIRRYPITYYEGTHKKTIWKVEVYDNEYAYFYEEEAGTLRLDAQRYLNAAEHTEISHFYMNGIGYGMGRPPFVFLKNNASEKSDLVRVKDLIDAYNSNRKRMDDMLEDFKNWIAVIKNYSSHEDNKNVLKEMMEKRYVFVDGDGGVDVLTPSIDTQASESHNQTIKDDIILFGQSVDRNKMQTGNAASGEALKRLYAGLDIKCNGLEVELNQCFNQIEFFIKSYLNLKNITVSKFDKIEVIYNRDIAMNESEAIEMCKNSVGVISNRTIVANHPWVTDLEAEIAELEKQNTSELEYIKQQMSQPIGDVNE